MTPMMPAHDAGRLSRRQALAGIGAAAVGWAMGGGALAARRGLSAVSVNHISYQSNDYTKIRDFYADLLGMSVSHDDGKQCYLAYGDGFLIARNTRSGGRAPLIDHIAYTISDWNTTAVEAELKRRGLDARPETDQSFHVKDPDGYDLQIAGKAMTADSTPDASSHGARGGAARHGVFKAVTVNHISYQSADFEKLRDFYADVLGMKVYHHTSHTGQQQTWLGFGDSYIIPRTSTRADMKPPLVDHIAFTIANWNTRAVEAELRRRSLDPRPDTDDSFIVRDPDGFMLQISGSNMKP